MTARLAPLLTLTLFLTGCEALSRVAEIGHQPALSPPADPTRDPSWRPLTMPMPAGQPAPPEANTLWRQGARAFFKDQRAAQVGDIVTVLVNITDTADLKNQTSTSRNGAEDMGVPNLFGLEAKIPKIFKDAGMASFWSARYTRGMQDGKAR